MASTLRIRALKHIGFWPQTPATEGATPAMDNSHVVKLLGSPINSSPHSMFTGQVTPELSAPLSTPWDSCDPPRLSDFAPALRRDRRGFGPGGPSGWGAHGPGRVEQPGGQGAVRAGQGFLRMRNTSRELGVSGPREELDNKLGVGDNGVGDPDQNWNIHLSGTAFKVVGHGWTI